MTDRLDVETVRKAFAIMGEYLRDKKTIGEIAVYGGSAILFQFQWRKTTQDVDAVVVSQGNHGAVLAAANEAARRLNLPRAWLSEAVSQYAAMGDVGHLKYAGSYPEASPGLRVFVASPAYILAMKLAALRRATADDRDFDDARRLALELGISTAAEFTDYYAMFFPAEPLSPEALLRLPELEEAVKASL